MTTDRERAAALDTALQGMFKALESRPVPEHVSFVMDQLAPPPSCEPAREGQTV